MKEMVDLNSELRLVILKYIASQNIPIKVSKSNNKSKLQLGKIQDIKSLYCAFAQSISEVRSTVL